MKPQAHQERLAKKLQSQPGQLMYWGLGSGKTFGAINAAKSLKAKATVITPASLQTNFVNEIKKVKATPSNYSVKSYDKFIRDGATSKNKDLLILDEAQKISNPDTERSRAITRISGEYKKRLLLTGTPIQNKPSDMSALINTVAGEKRLPTDSKTFNQMFLGTTTTSPSLWKRITKGERPVTSVGVKNDPLLMSKIKGLVDYYEPLDKSNYPTVTRTTVPVEMTKDQIGLYNHFEGKYVDRDLRKKMNSFAPISKSQSGRLNAFLSATRQASNTENKFTGVSNNSPKIKAIMDSIKSSKGPSLVYSNYLNSGLNPIAKRLNESKIPYGLFTGEQSKTEKANLVKAYNKGRLKALLVSSSGGEGLDLKGTRNVHLLEKHWNNAKLDQVIGRAVRYKSHSKLPMEERNVSVYEYLSKFPKKNSIIPFYTPAKRTTADEYLGAISERKQTINNKFLKILKQEGSRK